MTLENDVKALTPKHMKLDCGVCDTNVEFQANAANDKKSIAPEDMNVETGLLTNNVEYPGNEAIYHEDMKLDAGDIMMTIEPPTKKAGVCSVYQRKMEPGIVDAEETEQSEESSDSSTKEGHCMRGNSDFEESILVQNSSTKEDIGSDKLREKPALIIVGSNHKFLIHSRYLSDPAASCHDYCKFGHKHQSEKTRRLTLGTIRKSQPLMKTAGHDLQKCVLQKMTKKKELRHHQSFPSATTEKAPLRRLEDNITLRKDINQSKMKRMRCERMSSPVQSPKTSSRSESVTQAVKKTVSQVQNLWNTSTQKLKEVNTWKVEGSCSKSEMEVNQIYCFSETSLNKKAGLCKGVDEIKGKEPMSHSPRTSLKKVANYSKGLKEMKAKASNSPKTPLKTSTSTKTVLYKNHKSSSNSQNQINPVEPKINSHDDKIEPNANAEPAKTTSNTTVSGEDSQHSPQEAGGRIPQKSEGNKKGIGASQLSFSSRESFKAHGEKRSSEMTNKKQIGFKTEETGLKTSIPRAKLTVTHRLYNSEFKNATQNDTIQEDSQSGTSTQREISTFRSNTPREKSTVEQKPKRKEISNVEEKDVSTWKVKFKMGTVVPLQVANNAPKRLKFRRARNLSEDQIANTEIDRQLKKEHDMSIETRDKVVSEKVHLRHQEASEKKDDVDLNNVIEEFANKLVKTRKSKVKALVGAFETVMSLGDHKRLVETSSS